MKWLLIPSVIALTMDAAAHGVETSDPVPFPESYRSWVHVKTALIGPASPMFKSAGGFHHVYANPQAMEGLRTGVFTTGSILVFDRLTSSESDGQMVEGTRLSVDVMMRDSLRYADTGGWGFERFAGDTRTGIVGPHAKATCFDCHSARRDNVYVYSSFRK